MTDLVDVMSSAAAVLLVLAGILTMFGFGTAARKYAAAALVLAVVVPLVLCVVLTAGAQLSLSLPGIDGVVGAALLVALIAIGIAVYRRRTLAKADHVTLKKRVE